jgi:hypothetical protein
MHGKDCNQKHCRHGHAGYCNECAKERGETAENFDQDRTPSHEMRRRYTQGLQNASKRSGAFEKLGETMLQEAISNDQT